MINDHKVKLKLTHKTKNTESQLEVEYDTAKQIDQSSQTIVSVSNNCSVIVNVISIIVAIAAIYLTNT